MAKTANFINRELGWLEFNQRVLEEAGDAALPLLERLKFLAISAANLDEFVMVRVGGLRQLLTQEVNTPDAAGLTTTEQLTAVIRAVHEMVIRQYRCLQHDLEPGLAAAGLRRRHVTELSEVQRSFVERLFDLQVFPVLTPIAVASAAALPELAGLGINLAVRLAPATRRGRRFRFAVLPVPRGLARFIQVPSDNPYDYVLLEDVIETFIDRLFPGEATVELVPFRLTRNADLGVQEDQAGDLLARMKEVLRARKQSACVRLEVSRPMSRSLQGFLQPALGIAPRDIYQVPGPLDLAAWQALTTLAGFDALRLTPWAPQPAPGIRADESLFAQLTRRDLLLFHPYESFDPVIRLVNEAADDPEVLAIKQILYRTSRRSPIVAALARAAQNGKQVTALVELKARFDEARNIEWAQSLEAAGVQVIYGLRHLKVHAKCCIVVRREPTGLRRYVHFGTGNYNEITAQLYSDVSYLTTDADYAADASSFFNAVTGYSQPVAYRKLAMAPLGLRRRLLGLIEAERQRAKQGQPAQIVAKINSLVDPELISALYTASQAGVRIRLNVRGVCCLRPGVPGLSENISVVSIVDRFLEHARILFFLHGGDPRVFISSADWMPRNLDRRVELLVPIEEPAARNRLIAILETCLQDTVKGRRMRSDGTYERVGPEPRQRAVRAQETFHRQAREAAQQDRQDQYKVFEPQRPKEAAG